MHWLRRELILALVLMTLVGGGYAAVVAQVGVPRAGGLLGHSLGMVGFLFMILAETLYPLRKHWPRFTFGRMTTWLRWHIVLGLVGPFLVLLHTGWRFQGLAGWTTLATLIVVASGFVGRYLYTAVPRTLEGVALADADLLAQLHQMDQRLEQAGLQRLSEQCEALAQHLPRSGWLLVLLRPWWTLRLRWQLAIRVGRLPIEQQPLARKLSGLLVQRLRLRLQLESLLAARRLLALWHLLHIPLGGVLFTLAFLHVFGALYYSTFSRW